MTDEQPLIACLNYCIQDPETGYCLTCGRPPIPVSGINLNGLLDKSLKTLNSMTIAEPGSKTAAKTEEQI